MYEGKKCNNKKSQVNFEFYENEIQKNICMNFGFSKKSNNKSE